MLTDDLFRRLSGAEVDAFAALALLVCTVDAEGWPHPAMLSYFEVAAVDRDNVRLAVYKDSRTCANMRERGKATLIVVDAEPGVLRAGHGRRKWRRPWPRRRSTR